MVTDWRRDENVTFERWVYSNGPGMVEKAPVEGGRYTPTYDTLEYGQWANLQNAMLIVEMKHREVTLAAEVKEVEGLS